MATERDFEPWNEVGQSAQLFSRLKVMKKQAWRKFLRGASLQQDFNELKQLLVRYVKDETITPLKNLGRFIIWGSIGGIFVSFGTALLLVGSLRFLQEQFHVLDGSLSWIPYLIVAFVAVALLGITAWRIFSGAAKRRLPKP
jgi:hypothetical protein